MTIEVGTKLGRYEIRSKIGEGGMGEVYLAYDTELDRPVAIKFLPADVATDPRRMQRFIQEAKAASALNHPNILTIYEIVQTDGARFFVSEFVEGVTLRQHMRTRQMKLGEVLDIAIQTARALVAAHAAGIVHRDIKPENIMIRRDGYVKVLDFGLAKLIEREKSSIDTEAATRALVNTDPGAVMGTVNYMSPEQASGKELDARTDIWSLGVFLYEMLTGHLPFPGQSPSHTIVAILDNEPPPLTRYIPDAPEILQEIVSDALTKDPEARFQTIKQMLSKLQRLKQRVDTGVSLDHSVAPDSISQRSGDGVTATGAHAALGQTISGSEQTTAAGASVAPTVPSASSAEYVATQIKSHKKPFAIAAMVVLIAIAGGAALLYKNWGSNKPSGAGAAHMKISRLVTGVNDLGSASISPDGKLVAYAMFKKGAVSVRLKQVSTGSDREIVAPIQDGSIAGTVFSPDGELVYYNLIHSETNPLGTLYQVPAIGGREPKRILDQLSSIVSFAPDGKQFVFIRDDNKTGDSSLMVSNIDGGEIRTLSTRSGQDWFLGVPAWSPDGNKIICPAGTDKGGTYFTLVEVPAQGGAVKEITSHKWHGPVYRPFWLKDQTGIIVNAAEFLNNPYQIWQVSYPDGVVTRVTNDLTEYGSSSFGLTADSSTIVTIAGERSAAIWVALPNEEESRARKVTSGKHDAESALVWTPDGRIVYSAKTGDTSDIWIMNADGSGQKQLTANENFEAGVHVSNDGRFIFFNSYFPGSVQHIWRIDIDGGNPKQITYGDYEDYNPLPTFDGTSVIYGSWRSGSGRLWKVPIDGGDPVQFSNLPFNSRNFLSGGKIIFGSYFDDQVTPHRLRSALLNIETGQTVKVFDPPAKARGTWMTDEKSVIYTAEENGIWNVWALPIDGGAARQLTRFSSQEIFNVAISSDGKQLALSRGTSAADVILIKDFR
jgi:serine/threonine protein kinase/Tol biopolymer transport system component